MENANQVILVVIKIDIQFFCIHIINHIVNVINCIIIVLYKLIVIKIDIIFSTERIFH